MKLPAPGPGAGDYQTDFGGPHEHNDRYWKRSVSDTRGK